MCLLGKRVDALLNKVPKTLWAFFLTLSCLAKFSKKGLLKEEFSEVKSFFSDLATFPSVSAPLWNQRHICTGEV